jgi:hypothetical protein
MYEYIGTYKKCLHDYFPMFDKRKNTFDAILALDRETLMYIHIFYLIIFYNSYI